MPGSMSISGLASGLKTDDIIAKIIEQARRPQDNMQLDKVAAQQRLTAWQDLNTRILALKTKSDTVAASATFSSYQASSSDSGIVSANASLGASAGTYYLKVTSQAQAHQLSSQTFTSIDESIGTGTVDVEFTQDASRNFQVTIDSANNTLAGLRDAINRADKTVRAAIINSGTASSPAYRLMLTSTETGEASEFTADTTGLSGGTAPNITQIVQQAGNAVITFGEGVGAITVSKSTNTITDLIPGVTLNIGSEDPATTVKIDVTRNTSGVKSNIQSLVTQFNDLMNAIDSYSDYDVDTGESGLLLGDYDVQAVQMNIISALTGPVTGVDTQFSTLSSIGITLNSSGTLTIDDAELTAALTDNADDVAKLFASYGESDSSYISYLSSTPDTQPSGTTGWDVVVTQAARRAQVTAAVTMLNPLANDETLTIGATGRDVVTVDLTAGMTLSAAITEINKYSSQTGVSALATGADGTGTGNYLTLRSVRYGDDVDLTAWSSLSNGGTDTTGLGNVVVSGADPDGETTTGVGMTGLDVAGTINGEACTGWGQVLSANPVDEDSDVKGLMLQITGSGPVSSKVYFTKGAGSMLRDLLVNMTSSTGAVMLVEDSINSEIEALDDDIAAEETRISDYEERLFTQFSAMEARLATLQQQGSFLTAQLSAINKSK